MLDILLILLFIKVARWLFGPAVNEIAGAVNQVEEHHWKQSEPWRREQIVRRACAWRIIGRVVGAGALVTGACMTAVPTLATMWSLAAWRVLKPIKQELRDACEYRSTGRNDEPPYSW